MRLLGGGSGPPSCRKSPARGGVIPPYSYSGAYGARFFKPKGTEVLPKSFIFSCLQATIPHLLNGLCLLSVLLGVNVI